MTEIKNNFLNSQLFKSAVAKTREILKKFQGRRVFIYGGGNHTVELFKRIGPIIPNYVTGIFDQHPVKVLHSDVCGITVYSVNEIANQQPDAIILSSFSFQQEILRHLKTLELKNCAIIPLYDKLNSSHSVKIHSLTIETNDVCNLKCRFCDQNQGAYVHGNKPKTFMDFSKFKIYIDSIVGNGHKFDDVILHWLGEPFLHKQYIQMLDYILTKQNNFKIFRSDSNFNTITENQIDHLLSIARHNLVLTLALDATTQEVYKDLRIQGDINKAHSHIHYLIKKRKELNLQYPKLNFQFILQMENAHQTADFVKKWENIIEKSGHYVGDMITIMRLAERVEEGGVVQSQNELYDEVILNTGLLKFNSPNVKLNLLRDRNMGLQKTRLSMSLKPEMGIANTICPAAWKTPVICSDGRVTICCADANLDLVVADLNKEDFSKAWTEGEKITYLRILHLSGLTDKIKICRSCDGIKWVQISQAEINDYLKRLDPALLERTKSKIQKKFGVNVFSDPHTGLLKTKTPTTAKS